jgi:DNA-binding response OmpR family regulator
MPETILVIDDDYSLAKIVRLSLKVAGYTVLSATSGARGLRMLREHQPDLVLLDVMMPEMSGWELCEHIRSFSTVPIIFLTARQAEDDKVKGLDLGGDDYIVKPFRPAELRARISAALRRVRMARPPKETLLSFGEGDLVINTDTREVFVRGERVVMTPTEYRLLLYLAEQPGRALTTDQIYEAVWSMETDALRTNVKWYIWRLRTKIESDSQHPRFILTEPGVGYRFSPD